MDELTELKFETNGPPIWINSNPDIRPMFKVEYCAPVKLKDMVAVSCHYWLKCNMLIYKRLCF